MTSHVSMIAVALGLVTVIFALGLWRNPANKPRIWYVQRWALCISLVSGTWALVGIFVQPR